MITTETLSDIKVMSASAFESVTSTDDSKLYFVEDDGSGGGAVIEYSSGTSGYLIFPNGMCIQWGQTTTGNVGLTKTYADTNYAVFASIASSGVRFPVIGAISSASQINISYYSGSGTTKWMTIGQLASGQF